MAQPQIRIRPDTVLETRPTTARTASRPLRCPGGIENALGQIETELDRARRLSDQLLRRVRDLDAELALAEQVQRELLPAHLPQVAGARLQSWYAPADRVSGDFYDVYRADDRTIVMTIADATGHGVPAALMSAFLKRSLRCQDGERGEAARRPDEMLRRINADLISLGATQEQYVAAVCATYDEPSRRIRVARGGAPAPVLLRQDGCVEPVNSDGILLGVVPSPEFQVAEYELGPGDVALLWSDGLDNLLLGTGSGADPPAADWRVDVAAEGVTYALNAWRRRREVVQPSSWRADDITVLALECVS
ncbi:MAG: SpoIIE family protein phosphatase [Phycisphaerae bacterium]|nr:MAG: hypothetical protein EDS66_12605 [Planctomycetota bacterium]KAB2939258.1 MAG: SpoIIE family protein phosphatase [Phycisphaerae bacterium]MBE7455250.1 SpoIIE family protein phosphatase [Planctomycetia bacterium]MCK6464063.1 SpoIIE family protein phosphatase [Phycisphaerae bacterium]MCL4717764.1 SpoIIE family protein phosphatase [Phycisphaerae bacterium]